MSHIDHHYLLLDTVNTRYRLSFSVVSILSIESRMKEMSRFVLGASGISRANADDSLASRANFNDASCEESRSYGNHQKIA